MDLQNNADKMPIHQEKSRSEDSPTIELLVNRIEDKDSIINGISDAIMLLDTRTYKILDVNQAFLNSYRITRNQAIGKTCYEITHHRESPCPDSHSDEPCPLKETLLKGVLSHTEHVHKDREGKNVYAEITAYPLRDANGDISRIVHLSRDVTSRRLAEEALKEKVSKSEHLAALGRLVAEVTHEIKNPLLMIGGFARQLLQPVDEAVKIKKLTIITEQVARLERLLEDLRAYYLPKDPHFQTVDVREILQKVYSLVEDECERNNIKVEMISDEADMVVNWDPSRLEQVFLNAIKNSIEAMENGGKLTVMAKLSDDSVEITIQDNGCGISKAHMDKISKCFFTTKSYGTGLGLCNLKKYIDQHKGSSFFVESEENNGTTVKINLPIYQSDAEDHDDLKAVRPFLSDFQRTDRNEK